MLLWLKQHKTIIMTVLVTVIFTFYMYGCEVKTRSLTESTKLVNRQELQLELDQIIDMAKIRMADLDKQEEFSAIILQNALILVQGQPFNPIGIISAIAAIYGLSQGASNVSKIVKTKVNKRKANNGKT